uniref:Uncharacterized protein n=1 Tax=Arundo donax TaxID=35708 RepID=A0A0A9H6D1_ARUDO
MQLGAPIQTYPWCSTSLQKANYLELCTELNDVFPPLLQESTACYWKFHSITHC